MASWVQSDFNHDFLRGLIYWGFPLHAPGNPSNDRADHLYEIATPMLFLQGTRDSLANLTLLEPVVKKIRHAELFIEEGADHSFHVPKSSGKTDQDVLDAIGNKVESWVDEILTGGNSG